MDKCESCVYYSYDEDYDDYICEMDLDEDEYLHVERIPVSQIEEMVRHGEIRDAKTICALFLIKDKI